MEYLPPLVFVLFVFVLLLLIIVPICNEKFVELGGRVSPSALALRAKSPVNPNLASFPTHGLVDFRDFDLSDEHSEEAQMFHDQYELTEDQRRRDILAAYEELDKPMTVVAMFYCKNFVGLFENWAASCKDVANVRTRTIGFCLDQESYNHTRELGFQAIHIPKMSGDYRGFGAAFGKSFGQTMFYKNAIIYDLLRWLPCNVLFQDTDLVWFKDPIPYLETLPETISIMYDGPNPHFRNIYANTGFIYLKNNESSKALMETALGNTAYVFSYGGHQKPFDRILDSFERHGLLTFRILPEDLFANGHLPKVPKNAYVYHYSWTVDIKDKLRKLRELGLVFNPSLLEPSS